MAYNPPIVAIFQEFNAQSPEIAGPRRAAVIGPNTQLHRYAVEAERNEIGVGAYNADVAQTYLWPAKTAGSIVNQAAARVFIREAQLRYLQDLIGSGSTVAPVSGYKNRIRSSTLAFKTANGVSRSAALLDRDVQIGDLVWVRGTDGSDTSELLTFVRGFATEITAAAVETAEQDAANPATQAGSAVTSQVSGPANQLVFAVSTTSYSALGDGNLSDTYTITVLSGSTGGDLTTAVVRVTSASGYEYVGSFVPAAADTKKTVGVRGLQIGWDLDTEAVVDPGADEDDLIAGQVFQVIVNQAWTKPTATAGGTYTGAEDNTYIVTVIQGGKFADTNKPRVSIRTTKGIDAVPSVTVSALAEAVPLGQSGATLTFSGSGVTGLRLGDKYTIPVTAAAPGRTGTLVLGNNLDDVLLAATDLDLELYIQADVEIPKYQVLPTARYNWDTNATSLTLEEDCTAYHDSWTSGGTAQALTITAGQVYIEYEEWLSEFVGQVSRVMLSEVNSVIPGQLDPGNPLKDGVNLAASNSNGVGVLFTAVSDPTSLSAWTDAINMLALESEAKALVVMTGRKDVHDALNAHVTDMSAPYVGFRRRAFVPVAVQTESARVDADHTTDGEIAMGTIGDDLTTSGTQYTWLTQTSGNISFLDADVAPGDIVRFNYGLDALGAVTYSTGVVDAVINADTIRLATALGSAVSVAEKFEIWHTNSNDEIARETGRAAGAFANRRTCAIYCDFSDTPNSFYDGARACAAVAGLSSGLVQHQSMTTLPVIGLGAVEKNMLRLRGAQLDMMAEPGTFILILDDSGAVVVRDAITTDQTIEQSQDEMFTRNFDAISDLYEVRLRRFRGKANMTRSAYDEVRLEFTNTTELLKSQGYTALLGAPLIDADLLDLRPHLLLKNRLLIVARFNLPYEMKDLEVHLVA